MQATTTTAGVLKFVFAPPAVFALQMDVAGHGMCAINETRGEHFTFFRPLKTAHVCQKATGRL